MFSLQNPPHCRTHSRVSTCFMIGNSVNRSVSEDTSCERGGRSLHVYCVNDTTLITVRDFRRTNILDTFCCSVLLVAFAKVATGIRSVVVISRAFASRRCVSQRYGDQMWVNDRILRTWMRWQSGRIERYHSLLLQHVMCDYFAADLEMGILKVPVCG